MTSSFAASQLVPGRQRRGLAGAIADTGKNTEFADLEINGRAAQILTLTFSGSSAAAYTVEVPELGILISFTGGASDTLSAAAFVTAWNADFSARGFAAATSALGVATLTGVGIGDDFHAISLVPSSSVMTAAETQANGEPADFPVARAVYVGSNGKASQAPPTAGSLVLTPAAVNSAVYFASLLIAGQAFYITYTADGSATVQEIVEGMKADFDRKVPSALASASEDNTALTIEGNGSSVVLIDQDANTTPSAEVAGADLLDRLVGFSVYDYQSETAQGAASFAQNGARRVSMIRTGALYVENGDAAVWRDRVYLGIDSGTAAEYGKVFTTSGAGRIALPVDKVCWGQRPNVIELSLGR